MFRQLKNKVSSVLCLLILCIATEASASEIDSIDIDVKLDTLGTAYIDEFWTVDVDDENTEWYLSMKNMGEMTISDFKVFDQDQKKYYKEDTPWDVDRNREEKKGKSGIHEIDEGKELCWGVGTSGRHHWIASYKITGFVKKFQDGCGFNHTFINYDLSSAPKFARTTISMLDGDTLSEQNSKIWAFRFPGKITFEKGKIVAVNTEEWETSNSMVIMCIFGANSFDSPNVVNDTIGTMKQQALDGSDYEDDEDLGFWGWVFVILFIVFCGVFYFIGMTLFEMFLGVAFVGGFALLWNVISLRPLRIYLRRKKLMEGAQSEYYRGIPVNGDLHRSFYILDDNNYKIWPVSKNPLFAAYIMRLIRYKMMTLVPIEEDGKQVLRLQIAKEWIDVKETNKDDNDCLKKLYELIKKASGDNLILEKGELKDYSKEHPEEFLDLGKEIDETATGEAQPKEWQQLMGLQKFLKDFSLINERHIKDVALWDEYLVFATLFGMSEKVLKEFKTYCPDYFKLSELGAQLDHDDFNTINDFSSVIPIAAISDTLSSVTGTDRSSGDGGDSSFGGGGGCSGGGGGGGGR